MASLSKKDLIKISDFIWEIPKNFNSKMRVPARVFASEEMLAEILHDNSIEQLINVSTLIGIQKYALAMPDAHEGYGFPVGGVAGFDLKEGIISPGGIGYDINCGVRLLKSSLSYDEIKPHLQKLGREIYHEVPSGVGRGGRLNLNYEELNRVLKQGSKRIVEMGYGNEKDLEKIESGGYLNEAEPDYVSKTAKDRGRDQLGTIGAGNHFVEVDKVAEIFDEKVAEKLGLFKNQICVLIHTGSRGLGHQIATDYIRHFLLVLNKYKIDLADKELACAPYNSEEGQKYFQAMQAGANFAWANRQLITWEVRRAWKNVLGKKMAGELEILYDVSHNIAKIEEYKIDGETKKLIIHRKGATRAFPDQPVLIPGSMGTASYVLIGQKEAFNISFGSTCHGAGRRMSRTQAKKKIRGSELKKELENRGIVVEAGSMSGLAEEAPEAYKDVNNVVEVVHQIGIAKKVVKLKPVCVIKG
jgi:tRNA-splicing ligase RtcB